MGLISGKLNSAYYNNEGDALGSYQFVSLEDIISQFQIAYVGEGKIVPKALKADIAFHAQRALAELSFDTLKSVKSQQIDIPASLVMMLPQDYVNYSRLSWVDTSGIKHPLYPTNNTSNPFQIWQEDTGDYEFPEDLELIVNGDFSGETSVNNKPPAPWYRNGIAHINNYGEMYNNIYANGSLRFTHRTRSSHGEVAWGHSMSAWQTVDVSDQDRISIKGTGAAIDMLNGPGVLRLGVTTIPPDTNTRILPGELYSTNGANHLASAYDLLSTDGEPSYVEWKSADGEVEKEILAVDVSGVNQVYVLVVSFQNFTTGVGNESETMTYTNYIDNLSVKNSRISTSLAQKPGNENKSSTWVKYKSGTTSENQDDYIDDTYWPAEGSRYGLDPQHAQVNGSFFIDQRIGKIHFSSNISGKTVILDYISDSLGTDAEMQVHKFAEDAMYKHIVHAIVSTSSWGQQLVPRLTKEKFAAIRKAKLRLSNIKLEELTQILRGKSKQIKH